MTLPRSRIFDQNLQSSDVTNAAVQDVSSEGDNKVTITEFVDAEAGNQEIYASVDDSTYTEVYKADAKLAEFLSRPVKIYSTTWTVGSGFATDLSIWSLYFSDPVVKNKLQNYAFLRCNLHVKIMINASPFYYGLLGAFYEPLPVLTPAPIWNSTLDEDLVPLSQRPHIWCYPGRSQGGEMVLPFIAAENWLRATSNAELIQFGNLHLESFTDLYNANSVATGSCNVSIYAWAENVELCGPTYDAALQSTDVKRKGVAKSNTSTSAPVVKGKILASAKQQHVCYEGTVSGPASAVARATKLAALGAKAVGAQDIGTTLSAVSTAASCVSALAESYGCTDTPVISKVQPYKSLPFHAFSSADISSPIDKLTLDPQQSVVMSGHAIGSTDLDELNIEGFCRRESYIAKFPWTSAATVDDILFVSRVTPQAQRTDVITSGVNEKIYKTPMCLVSDMFRYWRGDIVYRIRVIASQYHRGRMRITWDPVKDIHLDTTTYSSNYTKIVDIEEENDIIVRIPYQQPASFSSLKKGGAADRQEMIVSTFGTAAEFTPQTSADNGQLCVRVFTEQTSPVLSADIQLIVSMWGENMEFAVPHEIPQLYTNYELQSKDVIAFDETASSKPLFEDTKVSPDINLLYFGENIVNLKQLMRRTCRSDYTYTDANGTDRFFMMRVHRSRMPLYSGYDPNGIHSAQEIVDVGIAPYNYVYNIPMNWIGMCFLAHRGSVNWQYNVLMNQYASDVTIRRDNGVLSTSKYNDPYHVLNGLDNSFAIYDTIEWRQSGAVGMSLINQKTQTGAAANCPMFSSRRFYGTSPETRTLGSSYDNSYIDGLEISSEYSPAGSTDLNAKYVRMDSFVSIGPDFCYHFFLNVPTIQWTSSMPQGQDFS